jgi:pyruvate/2-oxoglutarate dehydrogenase complex dihydrolipoamide dehydrogenase (E3) component
MNRFDAIVVGGGQAGPALAGRLAGAGMTVAVIEREHFGGTCVNTGCMPTKTMVASAYAAHLCRRAAEFGVVTGPVSVDLARVRARAQALVRTSREGIERWLRATPRCTVIRGHARFEGPGVLRVGEQQLTAARIFLNVGGRAVTPPLPGVDSVPHLNNSTLLALDRLPAHLVVVGGSYVGLEFAQMYRRFGAEVTVIEMQPRLIAKEDDEVSQAIREIFEREGITVRTSAECIRLAPHEAGVAVDVDCAEGSPEVIGSDVLLAVGRRPNTDDLGLDRVGVATDEHGYIRVDDTLATNVPGIWALGECNGHGAFTHTAYNDFEIAAANLLDGAGPQRKLSARLLGYGLFIDPPLGRVGQTERQARASGRPLLVGTRPMSRVSRAVEKGEAQGLMKVVADAETRQILGAAILGPGGDEAIHAIINAMNARVPWDQLIWSVPIHPTVAELLPTVLREMQPARAQK